MPKCKNDPTRTYKGTEPSPKGLGFCAHAEKLSVKRKGKDGNEWIINTTKSGIQRWIKHNSEDKLDCSKFVRYEKRTGKITRRLDGLQFRKGYIHLEKSLNIFDKEETKIPSGYKKASLSSKYSKYWKKHYHCDEKKQLLTKDNTQYKKIKDLLPKNTKAYFIHDNGGRPFVVYVTKKQSNYTVRIYSKDIKNYYIDKDDWSKIDNKNRWMYIRHIGTYTAKNIWIGKGYNRDWVGRKVPSLDLWYHKMFIGNSVLLQITKNEFIYIGMIIARIKFPKDDKIVEFHSVIGGNDVPYPFIIGNKNVYFLSELRYVPISKFSSFTRKDKINAFMYYYGFKSDDKPLSEYSKAMTGIKILQTRM